MYNRFDYEVAPNWRTVIMFISCPLFSKVSTGCYNIFDFLSMRIGNQKFPVRMRHLCENIMSNVLFWRKISAYKAFSYQNSNEFKEIKAKK